MQTIAIDFDGVIHSYTSPWTQPEDIADPPVAGAAEGMKILQDMGYRIIIFSARARTAGGVLAMTEYLEKHGIPYNEIDSVKPTAQAYLDDRGIRFDGNWEQAVRQIQVTQVWNKWKPVCKYCRFAEPADFPQVFCQKLGVNVLRERVSCYDYDPKPEGIPVG